MNVVLVRLQAALCVRACVHAYVCACVLVCEYCLLGWWVFSVY